jgi:hypothetical protein
MLMNKSSGFRALIAIVWVVGLAFLAMGLLNLRPSLNGTDTIAGAILIASGLIARAIADHAAKAHLLAKGRFVPDDLMADALDTRDD